MKNHTILSLALSAIIVDTIIGYYLLLFNSGGVYIKEWYNKFNIGAYIMDILSIIIGTYLSTMISDNILVQIISVVIIGLVHDISFGCFVNKVETESKILTLFKNYANELGTNILIVDAFMLVSTLILSHFFSKVLCFSTSIILSITVFYIGLFMIYSF